MMIRNMSLQKKYLDCHLRYVMLREERSFLKNVQNVYHLNMRLMCNMELNISVHMKQMIFKSFL